MKNNIDIVLSFIRSINQHDVAKLRELMSEDHLFVDAVGETVRGREQMGNAWKAYFQIIPDYEIIAETLLQEGEIVGVFGTAQGTYAVNGLLLAENHWKIPAAWKAVVKKNLIAEWRVYGDNEPLRNIMAGQ
jgi:ketosteroid isomerase-like protein